MEVIKIIIVDDHQIVRDGIKAMIKLDKSFRIIGEASDYDSLLDVLQKELPDIILLDISLPGKSGTEIAEILKKEHPDIKILILSANSDEESIVQSICAGVDGFLSKDTTKDELFGAIRTIYAGEGYFGEKLSGIIYKSYINHVKNGKSDEKMDCLSEREIEIIKLLSDGMSGKEIAEILFISPRTVETHRANILTKLNLKNNVDIVKFAIKNGIVKL